MKNAFISVIIPVYNVSEYVERCVNSLLEQTYQNLEIILINDGSTDNSGDVCCQIRDKNPEKIVYIEQENQGVSAARNAGLDVARGEYIVFIDADDWVSPIYIEKLYSAVDETNADLAACGFIEWHSEEKQIKHLHPKPQLYDKQEYYKVMSLKQVPLWSAIYKSVIIKENKIRFDTLLRRMEDGCFVADYTSYCSKMAIVPDYLYYYYQREGSAINSKHKSTLLGVERSAYIYKKLEKAYERSGISEANYRQLFTSKWVRFIPNTAIGLVTNNEELSNKEKRDFLKQAIVVSDIKNRLQASDISKCNILEKLLARWTLNECVRTIFVYAKTYYLLRKFKRLLKGAK